MSAFDWAAAYVGPNLQYEDTGLENGTTYGYRVFATDSNGESDPSNGISVTPPFPLPPPASPDNFAATPFSDSQIDLQWDAVQDATEGYIVWWISATLLEYETGVPVGEIFADELNSYSGLVSADDLLDYLETTAENAAELGISYGYTTTGDTTLSVTNLDSNTPYYFALTAINTMAYSQFATVQATTLASAIQTAPTLSSGTITVNSIVLNWTPVDGAANYRLEYSPNGINDWQMWYSGTALSYTGTLLAPGTDYSFRIFATNSGGDSPASSVLTKRTLCAAPTGVAATAQDQTTDIVIAWAAVTGAVSYVVEWCATSGGTYTPLSSTSSTSQTHAVGAVNTQRHYKVKAVNASGDSAYSSVVTTKTAPAAPTNLMAGVITQTTVAMLWTAPPGATTHKVECKKASEGSGAWVVVDDAISGTTVTATGLDPNTLYDFRLSSDNL